MPAPIVIPQIACTIAGFALGGSSTKCGGCFLLASFFLFGLGFGWWVRKRAMASDERKKV